MMSSNELDQALVQSVYDDAAKKIEQKLYEDMSRNLDLLINYLKKEKKDFKPRKFKRELLENIELTAESDVFKDRTGIENTIKSLNQEAQEHGVLENYLIITLYIYRYLIFCIYEYGFQPFFSWELYRGLKLCESFYKTFEYEIKLAQKKSDYMRVLAQRRHEETRKKDYKMKEEIKEIWLSHNWSSYTECADHIHQNNLIQNSNYRKIYSLVSKVAKEKK